MDFSFLRNWFNATSTSADSISLQLDNIEQSSSTLIDDDKFEIIECEMEDDDEFEFINPADPNEIHSLPSSYQIGESVAEIAGFNKEKLLEMSNFCQISYGNNDTKLSQTGYKTKAEFINEDYNIIPFYYSDGSQAGFAFTKDGEITITYHDTKGFNDIMVM